ncbi:hypothetical protein [Marivirga sp.]|uniref:hypothetical protein n=1 Tax=Marivirga sp. TaxID=2018662 RepID=UPI003DA73F33
MKNNKNKIMKEDIRDTMILVRMKVLNVDEGTKQILSLLGENTEGVSDASTKSGVLHDVGESHASVENCESDLASGELPLEKITDDGKKCLDCGKVYDREADSQFIYLTCDCGTKRHF